MDIIKDVEAVAGPVVGVATSAINPIGLYLKIAGAAVIAAGLAYGAYRVNSFMETAAEDHAARAVLTSQVSDLKGVNAANEASFRAKLAENEIIVARTNKLADDLAAMKATVANQREELRHAPSTSSYKPTASDRSFLDSVRKPAR